MRCMRDGIKEICVGRTEQERFREIDLQHPFQWDPDKHQPAGC